MSTAAKQTVHSGVTIKIKLKGKEIGRIQSIDSRRSFGQEGVYEIGSIMPQEHVANRYEGSVTVDKFFVKKKSLKDEGIAATGEDILKMDVIDIEVTDKITGDVVRVYEGCSLQDYSERFSVGAIAGENATWLYLNTR